MMKRLITVLISGAVLFAAPALAENVGVIWRNDKTANTISFNDAQTPAHQISIGSYNPATGAWSIAPGSISVGQTFTGGLISVTGSPVTGAGTLALTVAGTSGGIPYFASATTWASSAALAANQLVLGGGAGVAPATLGSLGTTTQLLHGNAAGAPSFGAIVSADVSTVLASPPPIGSTVPNTSAFTTLYAKPSTGTGLANVGTVITDTSPLRSYCYIGDGSSHALSTVTSCANIDTTGYTLPQWQVLVPAATALTDEVDWAAFQSVLDANTRDIYVPKGTAILNDDLVKSDTNVHIHGAGRGATVLHYTNAAAGKAGIVITNATYAARTIIEDLRIQTTVDQVNGNSAIKVVYPAGTSNLITTATFRELDIDGGDAGAAYWANGIYCEYCWAGLADHVTIRGKAGTLSDAGVGTNMTNAITLPGSTSGTGGSEGFRVTDSVLVIATRGVDIPGDSERVYIHNTDMVAVNYGVYVALNNSVLPTISLTNSHISYFLEGVHIDDGTQFEIVGTLFYKRAERVSGSTAIKLVTTSTKGRIVHNGFIPLISTGTDVGIDVCAACDNNILNDNFADSTVDTPIILNGNTLFTAFSNNFAVAENYVSSSCPGPATTATITVTIASPGVVTWTAHGFTSACPVVFTTSGALPTGITAGTTYWVVPSSIATNTFQIATSVDNALAGTSINTSGTQSGVHTGTASVGLTTATTTDPTAVKLIPGVWSCDGSVNYYPAGTTTQTAEIAAIYTVSGNNLPTKPANNGYFEDQRAVNAGLSTTGSVSGVRFNLAATTTIYLKARASFAVSTETAGGFLQCQRIP